tara:strand:- start:1066 stop:2871 length:1806 start_codon:yes stop_codon:yes gene_type:complete
MFAHHIAQGQQRVKIFFVRIGACLIMTVSVWSLTACGGGGSDSGGNANVAPVLPTPTTPTPAPIPDPTTPTPPTPEPPDPAPPVIAPFPSTNSREDSARFLTQSSFGPTKSTVDVLSEQSFDAWLDAQFSMTPSRHYPLMQAYNTNPNDINGYARLARQEVWFERVVTAPDQLRQRVAFALSEIMVVSQVGAGNDLQPGYARYYDILIDNAFGNFRTLLEDVTLSPIMGRYLSMLGNRKPNPAKAQRADENYAREIMQLFSIGLVQLNMDGTPVLQDGRPVPSYTQDDVENLARVFTGWWYRGASRFGGNPRNYVQPMQAYEAEHDRDAKTLIGGASIPAGLDAQQDLDMALDILFAHPNVGPFISKQLIVKLVTSNPSPAYVARVARVFNNNGDGVRGDLKAVVRAILLDAEARQRVAQPPHFGKPREPLLAQIHLWRLTDAVRAADTGRYTYALATEDFAQAALDAPEVFNFFAPNYQAPGAIKDAGLISPEFQLANESSVIKAYNRLYIAIFSHYLGNESASDHVRVDLRALARLSSNPAALVAELNILLLNGQMGDAEQNALISHLNTIPAEDDEGQARVKDALYLIMTSPQYQVQK